MAYGLGNFLFWVGNDTIDGNNSRLIDLYNLSAEELYRELDPEKRSRILERVIGYTFSHFELEEKEMNLRDYPSLSVHEEDHLLYCCRMVRLYKHFHDRDALRDVLLDLVIQFQNHVSVFDLPYARYLQGKTEAAGGLDERNDHSG